ncbi:tetratricopeptide repeat protein [Kitasatospora sp. NPDC056138]|uniref:tetratricopeptide repeat protein n=1 Tax=Kitasatospora sp. NPDC056138 TaxID=3345724 RepID=UPI0035E22837
MRSCLHARAAEPDRVAAEGAVRRAVVWYLAAAGATEEIISPTRRRLDRDLGEGPLGPPPPFADEPGALRWLDVEQRHLLTAVRTCAERGWDGLACQLADALWPLCLRLRPYQLWTEVHRIGLAAARRAGHPTGERRMLTSGGIELYNSGEYDMAIHWFEQALAMARTIDDRRTEAQALHGIGQAHHLAGRPAEAVAFFRRALTLREEIGHRRGAALSRISLGDACTELGRPADAQPLLARARADLLALPDRYEAARALALLGRADAALGRYELADSRLEEAIGEFRACGSRAWEARVFGLLGESALAQGRPDTARERYERALRIYESIPGPDLLRITERIAALPGGSPPQRSDTG